MNNAHTKIDAAAGASFCGYAIVRRLAAACLIGLTAVSAVQAGPRDPESRREMRNEILQQQQRQSDERLQRQSDSRAFEQRAEDQRRSMQMQREQDARNARNSESEAFRRSGRLTPDERRDLRRQINEAGADIYRSRDRRDR